MYFVTQERTIFNAQMLMSLEAVIKISLELEQSQSKL